MTFRSFVAAAVASLCLHVGFTQAAEQLSSVSKLTFGEPDTLFIADWKAARILALTVPVPTASSSRPFNFKDVQGPIAKALGAQRSDLRFEDMVVQPRSELAYVALTVQHGKTSKPALVTINADGKVKLVDVRKVSSKFAAISDAPAGDQMFWRDLPRQSLTITDMKFYDNKLYVAGLSNRSFASTLRVYDYPFGNSPRVSTIEMYHPVHNQIETRAPIRSMAIMNLGGVPTLVAAYTCTPLVTIPLSDLKDGAHIAAKTVGELGWGNAPTDLVTFTLGDVDYAIITNSSRAADLLPLPAIAEGAAKPGLNTPINWPTEPYLGVKAIMAPMAAVMRLDNLNKDLFLALRRDDASGDMQLVSIPKGAYLRLSDFVNEYDFTDYKYQPNDYWKGVHTQLRTLEGYPELAP